MYKLKQGAKKMTLQEIFNAAQQNNGIRATIDRFDDQFDDMESDNSYNWIDEKTFPLFEIRQDKKTKTTFIWIKENQNTDPRSYDYLEENCVIFLDYEDFYNFVEEVSEDVEE